MAVEMGFFLKLSYSKACLAAAQISQEPYADFHAQYQPFTDKMLLTFCLLYFWDINKVDVQQQIYSLLTFGLFKASMVEELML